VYFQFTTGLCLLDFTDVLKVVLPEFEDLLVNFYKGNLLDLRVTMEQSLADLHVAASND
jgi:hypothetical protein